MAKPTIKGNIVSDYLTRFPELPSLSVAKKVYKENSKAFRDIEDVRQVVRHQRGLRGKASLATLADKSHVKPVGHFKTNPYKLPDSHADKREPYILPLANNNVLVMSDFHVPYHDISAITAAFKYGVEQGINTIIILGDLIDFHQLSRFEKDPRARSTKEEFDATRELLVQMRATFPTQKIIYIRGNHDIRYEKWLYLKAPEIFDDPHFAVEERLRLNELRIETLRDSVLIKAGKLILSHGHLTVRGVFAPVNAARGVFMKAKTSMMIGHCHQTSEHTEMTLKGDMISCWSIGCLCTLHPEYDSQNTRHNHGFAHIKIGKDGEYSVNNKRIFNGVIL